MSKLKFIPALLLLVSTLQGQEQKSTEDLSFLIGEWEVTRTYYLYPDSPRVYKGNLTCDYSLDKQFISCRYEINRPGKIRGLDQVFFNYNSIYDSYETVWLSSTWPIKTISKGELRKNEDGLIFKTYTEFPIENEVMEYVRGELVLKNSNEFQRDLHIRTSKDPEGEWKHHMTTMAKKVR